MNRENKIFSTSYIVLALLFVIRLLPFAFKDARMWGFNHLIFLPSIWTVIYIIIAAVALALPFLPFARGWGEIFVNRFSTIFFESSRKYLYRLIFIAIMGMLFILFPMKTHFLGDGYAVLANVGSESGSFVKWSEKGITLILLGIQSLFGPKNQETALMAFRIVSTVAGMVTIWFFFLISEILSEEKTKRLLAFAISFLSGALLLFFGYVENYPLIWVGLIGFIYFGMRFLKKDRGLVLAGIFLVFGLFIHLQMAIFIPAFVYLTFCKGKGLSIFHRFKPYFLGLGAILVIGAVISFIKEYNSNLYFENIFLPLFRGKPIDPSYALLGIPHLVDIFNLIMLLSPSLILLPVLALACNTGQTLSNKIIFLAMIASAGLAFLFIIDPTLGMPRDWDLFSITVYATSVLLTLLINLEKIKIIRPLIMSLMAYLFLSVVPYFMVNLDENASIDYAKANINLDMENSLSTMIGLREYYRKHSDTIRVDSLNTTLSTAYPNQFKIDQVINALSSGDRKQAEEIALTITPDRFSSRYHDLLSAIFFLHGEYHRAFQESDKAIQLQKYNYQLYFARAMMYKMLGDTLMALQSLRTAYRLDNREIVVVHDLAMLSLMVNPDSAVFYGERALEMDSTVYDIHYALAKAYCLKGAPQAGKNHYDLYMELGGNDPLFEKRCTELAGLMNK